MKTITININGKDTEITLTQEQLAQIESSDPMQEVYKYHNTTATEFDKLYANLPNHVKAYQQECMIVAYYNKGWVPDFSNKQEIKYFTWFYLDGFRLNDVCSFYDSAFCSAHLCYKRKEDALEAVQKFENIYRQSRQ